MNKKNREIANATVVLTAISMGISIVVSVIGLIVGISSMSVFNSHYGGTDLAIVGIIWGVVIFLILAALLAMKICTFVFAKKGRDSQSRGYVLAAAILSSISGLAGDVLCIAAAVCGYILYDAMKSEETIIQEYEQDQNSYNDDTSSGNQNYSDNYYGMR